MDSRMDSRTPQSLARHPTRMPRRGATSLALAIVLGLVALLALGARVTLASPSGVGGVGGVGEVNDTYTGHWTQPAATTDIRQADESASSSVYQSQYGFFAAKSPVKLAADEMARLAVLVPYARVAVARVNSRYGAALQPEMVLWWTHADGIRAHVNYSNCGNEQDQYFSHLHNCDKPWFWQLGAAADQFSYVVYLQQAVEDMYGLGAAANAALIQRLGQQVLNFDQHVGTTPTCGGYPCTFPTTTIGDLMKGVSLQQQTDANWYASLLMRDPGIGSWMTARALRSFSRTQTRGWVGCYYAASCWQRLSDRMGDILGAWPNLVQLSATLPPADPVHPAPTTTATATGTPTDTPTAPVAPSATDTPGAAPTDTPTSTPTALPTLPPSPPGDGPIWCRWPIEWPHESGAQAAVAPASADAAAVSLCPW